MNQLVELQQILYTSRYQHGGGCTARFESW